MQPSSHTQGPRSRGLCAFLCRALAIVAGGVALLWHPDPAWLESAYADGAYAVWQHAASTVTLLVPFSCGDLVGLAAAIAVVWGAYRSLRARQRLGWWRVAATFALDLLAIAGILAVWFEAGWGWNYQRTPIEVRARFEPARLNDDAIGRVRTQAIAQMNRLAPLAHARSDAALDLTSLRLSWLPVVQRLGDSWTPNVGNPKWTIAGPFMNATGTSGFINPFTLESQLAPDLLWFERPFDLAHEWTHVAAFAREDEANYVAALTCLRSPDPVQQYSGWMELFLVLPPGPYTASTFSPLVWQDFGAIRERNARHLSRLLATLSWRTYNTYLKSNGIASGIANYNEVTRLFIGIPRDASGLPLMQAVTFTPR